MLRSHGSGSLWRGAVLVAGTYVYFLIFAQFAFLKRLVELGIADAHFKAVMGAMAVGGVAASLLAPRVQFRPAANVRLCGGFAVCAAAAWMAMLPLSLSGALSIALAIGAGLGLLTVTLATHLRELAGERSPLLAAGLGTGAAYLLCNFPPLFTASAEIQSWIAGMLCIVGAATTLLPQTLKLEQREIRPQPQIGFGQALLSFTALVWMDSAAFFIIQNTPALKAGTWEGALHLWANGAVHFAAALAAVFILSRKGLGAALVAAFVSLGAACVLLVDPSRAPAAAIFYPVGVSLYSVALVAYPSLLSPATSVEARGRIAGWIYAIAGWIGSAMGIGMAQNLHRIPPLFVAGVGAVVLVPAFIHAVPARRREFAVTGTVLLSAFALYRIPRALQASPQMSRVERGRQVYISEGCIHCHSQYVRPNSRDELMWGPVETTDELRLQHPPLIGNRRQGPDLSEVGLRRSALWLKEHFFDPGEVSGASIMPTYGFLFDDGRGDDLVAYLASLRGAGAAQHLDEEKRWEPSAAALPEADAAYGNRLYMRDCATCHASDGRTRVAWRASFKREPADFASKPCNKIVISNSPVQRMQQLARIAKFGISGTDMPGHEYLSDRDVVSISLWLSQFIAQPNPKQ